MTSFFLSVSQVGDSAAAVLGGLGRAFESLDVKAAAAAARGLADAAAGLAPKSSERARFGRRLASFAGPLRSGDCEELKQVREKRACQTQKG